MVQPICLECVEDLPFYRLMGSAPLLAQLHSVQHMKKSEDGLPGQQGWR